MFITARDGFKDISSSALDVSVSHAVRRRFVGQSSKKPCLADTGRHCVPGFLGFSSFCASSARVANPVGGLTSHLFSLSCSSPARGVRPPCVSALALLCRFPRRSHEEVQSPTSAPREELYTSLNKIYLSFDLWTAENSLAIIGVIIYYLSKDLKSRTKLIAIRTIEGPYTDKNQI